MDSKTLFRVLVIAGLVVGIAAVTTMSRQDSAPRLISVKPAAKRTPMPAFSWPSMSGHKWSMSEHKGKIVLVNFWATWCGPCRVETPDLVRVYEKYKGRGVTIAAVSMDEDPAKVVPRFVERYRMEYPVLVPAPDSPITEAIQSLPTSFLVDTQGRVARTWVGMLHEEELIMNIDELLAEGAGPT
ncbi:MAG: TlpA disulfide reductase family protein [Bryobacteraceae bacterium]|nr:TlpA disulfide reductase family protein [Bryobacteraceae bacterium]